MILKRILMIAAILALLSTTALAASTGSVTRSFSVASISPGGNVTITLTPNPSSLFAIYQVIETLPEGFTFISSTVDQVITGQQVKLTSIGSSPISYTVRAPSNEGSYTFDGSFKDADLNTGTVSGNSILVVSGTSAGYVSRSFSSVCISPGSDLTVRLTPYPSDLFGAPGYQVTETIPDGLTFLGTTGYFSNTGNVYTFTQLGSQPIEYVLSLPMAEGNYSFNGSFKDMVNAAGTVSGASSIIVEDVIAHYAGSDNIVNRSEALNAVADYFNMILSKEDALKIVAAFFTG